MMLAFSDRQLFGIDLVASHDHPHWPHAFIADMQGAPRRVAAA